MKNRVAAQSARDRKKAHMDQLEITLQRVEKEVNVIYLFFEIKFSEKRAEENFIIQI